MTTDKSGLANHGTISGPRTASGKYGRAVSLDRINDYISLPDSSSLDLCKGMTMEAWVSRPIGPPTTRGDFSTPTSACAVAAATARR